MASIELGQPDGVQPDGVQPSFADGGPARLVIPVNGGVIPIKRPDELLLIEFDWNDTLPEGVTLESVEHTVPSSLVRDDQEVNDDGTSDLDLSGGAHAAIYQLAIVATLSDASTVTRRWPIRVFNS